MLGKRQFSLRYLLLLVFCWALALAATRQFWIHAKDGEQFPFLWILAAGLAWCAALAGTFFDLAYSLKLARFVLPMWACLLVLGGAFGPPLRNVLLIGVLMASTATVILADVIVSFFRRQRDRTMDHH